MMKQRGTILVSISLILGSVAAWAANSWVNERLTPDNEDESTELVAAANMDISYGTRVEPRHVKMIRVPRGIAPEGHYSDAAEVEGKVATTTVAEGEILIPQRFGQHDGGSTLAALLSPHMRAVTVRVDDVVGVAGFLLPGNRVDVLAARSRRGAGKTHVETILQHVRVLAVDQTASTERNEPIIVRAVTLELTAEQSEELFRAREEGRIQLALRNPNEKAVVQRKEPASDPEDKPDSEPESTPVRIATPPPRVPSNITIMVIRGTQVQTERAKT